MVNTRTKRHASHFSVSKKFLKISKSAKVVKMIRSTRLKRIQEVIRCVSKDQYRWCQDRGMYMTREDLMKRFQSSVIVRFFLRFSFDVLR